jgi:hypothetical protein
MSSPIQTYSENFNHSHEAAVQSVYDLGYADGIKAAAAAFLDPSPAPATPAEIPTLNQTAP